LKGEDITSLNYKELMTLEEALENGLTGVRDKKAIHFLILIIIIKTL
jgi:MADS-box transcription factor